VLPYPNISIEGYLLIRKIGEGGFGEVWMAKSETTGAWKALKWISRASHRHLDQELDALKRYSTAISGARSPHLVPIEHVRLLDEALIYVMPLADGFDDLTPDDPEWEPVTLSAIMARHKGGGTWLSLDEIKRVIDALLQGASVVADAGLQHRDIKPENVLLIGGEAGLGDFGLATEDMTQVSMRGTPHYSAPSWYFESGGNADQWGIAILLYQLLTGNAPDKIGKPKYQVPAMGMGAISQQQMDEWNRLQSLVNRATSEVSRERFQGLDAFRNALLGASTSEHQKKQRRLLYSSLAIILVIGLTVSIFLNFWITRPGTVILHLPTSRSHSQNSAGTESRKSGPPAILNQTNEPHILSQEDVEQMNAYTSSMAKKSIDAALKAINSSDAGLTKPSPQPIQDSAPK